MDGSVHIVGFGLSLPISKVVIPPGLRCDLVYESLLELSNAWSLSSFWTSLLVADIILFWFLLGFVSCSPMYLALNVFASRRDFCHFTSEVGKPPKFRK